MKTLIYILASIAVVSFSSCSKSLILSDGTTSKEIKVLGKIKTADNYVNFISVKGTHYHIDLSKYTYTIKGEKVESNNTISLK